MDKKTDTILKFTVVTISYNSERTIQRCIDSVKSASCSHSIQHCFVDGGSTDGTVEIIRANLRDIDILISEPDKGISDAFNKGIRISKGIYVHILNSDDWAAPDFWKVMWDASCEGSLDILHSDLHLYYQNKKYKEQSGRSDYFKYIDYEMRGIFHPSMIVKKNVYDIVGDYSLKQKSTMDLEWLQRALDKNYISRYISGAVINFTTGSGQSFIGNKTVVESLELAKKRKVSYLRIVRMKYGKVLRIFLHSYYAGIKQFLLRKY